MMQYKNKSLNLQRELKQTKQIRSLVYQWTFWGKKRVWLWDLGCHVAVTSVSGNIFIFVEMTNASDPPFLIETKTEVGVRQIRSLLSILSLAPRPPWTACWLLTMSQMWRSHTDGLTVPTRSVRSRKVVSFNEVRYYSSKDAITSERKCSSC